MESLIHSLTQSLVQFPTAFPYTNSLIQSLPLSLSLALSLALPPDLAPDPTLCQNTSQIVSKKKWFKVYMFFPPNSKFSIKKILIDFNCHINVTISLSPILKCMCKKLLRIIIYNFLFSLFSNIHEFYYRVNLSC